LEAHHLLGALALRAGRIDEAITESSMAIELAETCELPYERALALTLLSETHLAAGRNSDATAPLMEARSTFSSLEARPALLRAEALATRLGLKLSGLGRNADLTEREMEVLHLIVAGRTNQAIADDLFISWTTARTHVSNIFRKLGVSTRAEAVDSAHRRGLARSPEFPRVDQ
jgi:ATP/maltotriose-dependent transcriptional regulator MalT